MPGKIYLSTAYLPPAEYFARIRDAGEVLIEREENYHKQSYRNRCYIMTAGGTRYLTVPVYLGSLHKTHIKDIRIDYSKRWQNVHLGALTSAYNSSPFFIYYFEAFEKIILRDYQFLLDLNMELISEILKILKIEVQPVYTTEFMPVNSARGDYRYTINPKKESPYVQKEYFQVFNYLHGFVPQLSIIDLLFNMGPEAGKYL